jgi:quinol monooxygenase YgiN
MIVNRRTFIVKKGCSEKVVALLRTVTEGMNAPKTVRIYEWYISPSDQVTWEGEFENLEAYAKFSSEWMSNPKRAALLSEFNDLTVSGGTSEILKVS